MFMTTAFRSLAAASLLALGLATPGVAATTNDYSLVWDSTTQGRYDDGSTDQNHGKNDCSGDLGDAPSCSFKGSPMIVKFDFNDDGSLKKTTVGEDFAAFFTAAQFIAAFTISEFEWAYTPLANMPGITAFSAKGGDGYRIYEKIGAAFQGIGDFSDTWTTPINPSGEPAGLSHITFFDSAVPIPLPAGGLLLLTALGGLGIAARRRRKA